MSVTQESNLYITVCVFIWGFDYTFIDLTEYDIRKENEEGKSFYGNLYST